MLFFFILFFFFNDTATTEIYTLSLHDALPILAGLRGDDGPAYVGVLRGLVRPVSRERKRRRAGENQDRKSTRLNSSHSQISYAVFCLKKKKKNKKKSKKKTNKKTKAQLTNTVI